MIYAALSRCAAAAPRRSPTPKVMALRSTAPALPLAARSGVGLGDALSAVRLQHTQRLYGNRAAQRLVQRSGSASSSRGDGARAAAKTRLPAPPSEQPQSPLQLAPLQSEARALPAFAISPARVAAVARGERPSAPAEVLPVARVARLADLAGPGAALATIEASEALLGPSGATLPALAHPVAEAPAPGLAEHAAPAVAAPTAPHALAALQTAAKLQSQVIANDAQLNEAQVVRVAQAHRQRIGGEFAGVRSALTGQLAQSGAALQGYFAAKGAEVGAAAAATMRSAQEAVTTTVTAADAQVQGARKSIDGFVAGATGTLQQRVQQVGGQIAGAIRSVPFPDLPGVATVRVAAAGLADRAAGALSGGLGLVRDLIGAALQSGAQLLGNLLNGVRQAATSALAQAGATIQRGVQAVATGLSRLAGTVIAALRNVLAVTVVPTLNRIEAQAVQSLETARQQAVTAICANRDQHLRAIADALRPAAAGAHPGSSGGAPDVAARPGDNGASALQALGDAARHNARAVLQIFEERTTTIVGSVVAALHGGVSRLAAQVTHVIAQATQAVTAKMQQVGEALGRVAQAVGSFVRALLQDVSEKIAGVVATVRALVQEPIDTLLQFAQGAVTRALGFVGGWLRRLLSGDFQMPSLADVTGTFKPTGGPITKPPPGPITFPGLAPILIAFAIFGAIVLFVVPELAVVITALMALGLSATAALVVLGVLALLALILLFVVVYLLYQAFKPAPKPAPPPPEQIHSLTVVDSPGARTRTTIGVGEQVVLSHTPGPANWTTTAGTLSPNSGVVVILTAPDTAQTVTVTGGAAALDFSIVVPSNVHMDRFSGTGVKHTKDHADSGIETLPFLLPDTVNFSRIRYREINVGAAVTSPGAYSCHAGVGHCRAQAGGACPDLFMTDTVVGGKGTQAVLGDCVYSGDCLQTAPFTLGTISFTMPYEYKVDSSAFRQFAVVNQVSALAADATTLTSEKAGAKGATTVPAASGVIPQCP